MCCNSQIHDELKNMEESTCPFCDQLLVEGDKEADSCCSVHDVENYNGMNVCLNCGLVHGYAYVNDYIDFYENMHRIHRKSIYQRKYHIENVCFRNRVELTHDQRDRIHKVFVEIGTILHLVNRTRKRVISINFIMRRIFEMMDIPYKQIPISTTKKTLALYDQYWASIMSLIGDKIKSIVGRTPYYISFQIGLL